MSRHIVLRDVHDRNIAVDITLFLSYMRQGRGKDRWVIHLRDGSNYVVNYFQLMRLTKYQLAYKFNRH